MPRVETVYNVAIFVYADDHNPAHFHAIDGDDSVLITIADLRILAGSIQAKKLKAVLAWAAKNQALLTAEWNRLNP